jgi:hypothetical protein
MKNRCEVSDGSSISQDFIVLDFFVGGRSWGRKRCVREINVSRSGDLSMREIRLLRGRLPRKGGGLTGMLSLGDIPPVTKIGEQRIQDTIFWSKTKSHDSTIISSQYFTHDLPPTKKSSTIKS